MKRGKVLMTVLVVLAVLFASCSNGMSKDDADGAAHTEKVMVSLGVDVEGAVSQKAISADTNLDGLTYWYKANHNWTQAPGTVHGDTGENFIQIPDINKQNNLGYFTAGQWTFYVEVRKGDSVIYSGNTEYNIYTQHANPTVVVSAQSTTGKGSVIITVKVPTTGPAPDDAQVEPGVYHETLAVHLKGGDEGAVTMKRLGTNGGLTTFTGTRDNLTPGPYTFMFRYTDEKQLAVTEGTAQAVIIFAGQTTNITGTIDGGKWHSSAITVDIPGIKNFNLTAPAEFVTPNTGLVCRASAQSVHGNDITFQWFLKGVENDEDPGEHDPGTSTYTFQNGTCGLYNITCSAIDANDKVIASETLWIEVGYKVTFAEGTNGTVAYGTNSGASTIFAAGDIVSMSVTPNKNYKVSALSPTGQYDDASHTAAFYMPAANTEFSVTFAEKAYTLTIADNIENGTVETVKADTKYDANEIVKLNVTPASGYHLKTLTMNGNDISASYIPGAPGVPVNPGKASFKMPAEPATVTATFEADAP